MLCVNLRSAIYRRVGYVFEASYTNTKALALNAQPIGVKLKRLLVQERTFCVLTAVNIRWMTFGVS